jgi:hypothetical protein
MAALWFAAVGAPGSRWRRFGCSKFVSSEFEREVGGGWWEWERRVFVFVCIVCHLPVLPEGAAAAGNWGQLAVSVSDERNKKKAQSPGIPIIQNARIVEQNCDLGRFKL